MTTAALPGVGARAGTRWALLLGNFAIGCGVMVVPGALNDLARDLAVPVATAGQVITVAAWAMVAFKLGVRVLPIQTHSAGSMPGARTDSPHGLALSSMEELGYSVM